MSLPAFSVRNPVLVNMLMVVVLAAGAVFAYTLVREMFPESRPDRLAITVVYPAVQPEEIEKAVTIKIEDAVFDIDGVEKVDSTISEGMSTTTLRLYNWVDDADSVLQQVKNEVDAIEDLPDGVEKITIHKLEPRLPVISVALFGPGDEAARKRAVRRMRDDLLTLPGVSDVQISGTRDDEISVEVLPERLLEYDVTFDEVAEAIRSTNLDVSGGQLKGDRLTVAIRTLGEETRGVGLEDIAVRTDADGRKVLLREVAEIRDDFVESDLESYFNGQPAASCIVYKTGSQDVIQIATLVKAYVAGKQNAEFDPHGFDRAFERPWYVRPFSLAGAGLSWVTTRASGRPDPAAHYEQSRAAPFDHDFQVALHSDMSRFVEGRLDLLTRNGKTGLLLVLCSLYLFLNSRVAFWAAVGLPVSFLGTFIVMAALGATINLLTMFGLIIVLGIIVDDAIVIGENIYRHVENGLTPREAAIRGAEEVMWPVTIAVTTTIAAFAPLLFIQGQIGDFMGQLPIVVLAALSVSLVEALIILPTHLAHLPTKQQLEERSRASWFRGPMAWIRALERVWNEFLMGSVLRAYERFLAFALRWRYVTIAAGLMTTMASAGLFLGRTEAGLGLGNVVKWEFVQKMDSELLIGAVEMPVGTPASGVRMQLQTLSDAAVQMPEVRNVQMLVALQIDLGGTGITGAQIQPHLGQLIIELAEADERERAGQRSSTELLAELRRVSEGLAGVNSVTWEALDGGPAGKDIEIRVSGEHFPEIIAASAKVKEALEAYSGVEDIADDYEQGKREVRLRLRDSARPTGVTVSQLGNHVRSAMYGREARRVTRSREDVRIMVRYPENQRESLYHLESMWIPGPGGNPGSERGWIPLGEVAELAEGEGYTSLHRSQQRRSISVSADVDSDRTSTSYVVERLREEFLPVLREAHPGVSVEFLGSMEEQAKAFSSLKLAFPVALLLVYMLLAGLFRSYAQPLVVMSAIPFGFQGAVLGHLVTANPITVLSLIGLVALVGILVNDSLVLVNFVNTRIRDGMSDLEASIEGAKLRLRPILLTTVTTIAGLTPLMFETSFQAKFLIPMAVTLTFGLAFGTLLTLLIVPALNMVFYDVRRLFGGTAEDHGDGAGLPA